MIAVGIGASSQATRADIDRALLELGVPGRVTVDRLATFAGASFANLIADAARMHGAHALLISKADMLERASECLTSSGRSLAAHGVPSVAEACALAAAGAGSQLLGARVVCGVVTVALAESPEAVP